jgi:type I restriction enzyme R subunit
VTIGSPERATQDRVIALFRDELGYRYLGDWTDREGNSNIEEELLTAWLSRRGHAKAQVVKALRELSSEAGNPNRSLYENN